MPTCRTSRCAPRRSLQIRAAFVVGAGYDRLLTADYSQIEMRLMAHLSQDAGLIEAFRSGEDLHNTVASKVLGVPVDTVDAEQRRRIKAMSWPGVRPVLVWTVAATRDREGRGQRPHG
ncbi:MAG: DNA polymerase [Candidatus Nanopelagicales bacterium]